MASSTSCENYVNYWLSETFVISYYMIIDYKYDLMRNLAYRSKIWFRIARFYDFNKEWYELEVINNNSLSTLQEGGEYLSSYVCDQKVAL